MNSRTGILAAAAASLLIAGLAGCTAAAPSPAGPAVDPAPIDVPSGGDGGDWVENPYLDEVVAGNATSVTSVIGQWEAEDCTVQAAVDGGTMCSTYLSGAGLAIEAYQGILVDYRPGAGGDLDAVYAAANDAYPAARAWVDDECNWETTEACAEPGQAIIDGAYALQEALAAWAR
jgi:hypothetical protein